MEGNFVRVMAWYDNEWGFSNRMADTAAAMAEADLRRRGLARMADSPDDSTRFEDLKGLVNASFPELRRLRCGNEQFYLASDVDALGTGEPGSYSRISPHTLLSDPENPVITLAIAYSLRLS